MTGTGDAALDEWRYSPAQDLELALPERLRRFPREPDMGVYGVRVGCAALMRLWLRTYHRLRSHGHEHLPESGSYILVANHSSHLDAACIVSSLRVAMIHRVFPAAAHDYFFVSLRRLALAAIVINALPFDREVHVRQSLGLCRALLANPGNVLVLFPEGSRSIDGNLGPFKPGIGLLLAGSETPVLPCYLDGAGAAWRKGTWLPRPRRIVLRIGPPRSYAHVKRGGSACQSIADDLRAAVVDLSRQTAE